MPAPFSTPSASKGGPATEEDGSEWQIAGAHKPRHAVKGADELAQRAAAASDDMMKVFGGSAERGSGGQEAVWLEVPLKAQLQTAIGRYVDNAHEVLAQEIFDEVVAVAQRMASKSASEKLRWQDVVRDNAPGMKTLVSDAVAAAKQRQLHSLIEAAFEAGWDSQMEDLQSSVPPEAPKWRANDAAAQALQEVKDSAECADAHTCAVKPLATVRFEDLSGQMHTHLAMQGHVFSVRQVWKPIAARAFFGGRRGALLALKAGKVTQRDLSKIKSGRVVVPGFQAFWQQCPIAQGWQEEDELDLDVPSDGEGSSDEDAQGGSNAPVPSAPHGGGPAPVGAEAIASESAELPQDAMMGERVPDQFTDLQKFGGSTLM